MNSKRYLTSVGVLMGFFMVAAFAQEAQVAVDQKDVDEQNKLSAPVEDVGSNDMIDEWKERVMKDLGISELGENDGKFFSFGYGSVSLKDTDPEYGDALVNAFDIAMMEAQQEMLMARFGRILVEKARQTYRDSSTYAKDIPLELNESNSALSGNKAIRIFEKALSVVEGKLDQELQELGVDESEYKAVPVEKKKTLFMNAFIKNTIKRASGEIAGLFPIQTAVMKDKAGNACVGVFCVMSDKTVQVAKDISLQRNSLIRGRGKDIEKTMVPKKPENWVGQIGTRLVYDQDGTPAIVSYGIGSFKPDGDDDYINNELRKEAQSAAVDNADAQIAEVVNGRMSAESSRQQGETVEKSVSRQMVVDSATLESTVKNIIKTSQSQAKLAAKMDLKGITTLATKTIKLPTGQTMCFAVRVWKYSTLNAINQLNRPRGASTGVHGSDKGSGQAGSYEGFKVNDLDDF